MKQESPFAGGGSLPEVAPRSARLVLEGHYRLLVVVLGPGPEDDAMSLLGTLAGAVRENPAWWRIGRLSGSALALAGFGACSVRDDLPEPRFAISVGDAVRRGIPTAARATLTARTPLRQGLVEAPFGGGFARSMVRSTDVLFVFGESPEPLVLELEAGGAVRCVKPPFGPLDRTGLRADALGPARHRLVVGPAGEAGVPFANLGSWTAHSDAAPSFVGRGGVGFTVARTGLVSLTVEDAPEEVGSESGPWPAPMAAHQELAALLETSPRLLARARGGTLELEALRPPKEPAGYQEGSRAPLGDNLRASAARSGKHGCVGCPTPCGWQFDAGPLAGGASAGSKVGARYAALQGFLGPGASGGPGGADEAAQALSAVAHCNQLGIDARSAARLLQLAPEDPSRSPAVRRLDSTLDPNSTLGALARAFHTGRDSEPARPFAPGDLAASVGAALSARGPEPLRSLSILGLSSWARTRLEGSLGVRGLIEDPEYNAGVIAHWHESFAAAIDATGFCAFSAAGLMADGLLDLDGLARLFPLAAEVGGVQGGEAWLEGGAEIAAVHRQRFPRRVSPETGLPVRAVEGYRAALRRGEAPAAQGVPKGEDLGALSPDGRAATTRLTMTASGALAHRLGRSAEAIFEQDGRVQIPLEFQGERPTVRGAVERLAQAVPSAANWLLSAEGHVIPAVLVDGRPSGADAALADGASLELLVVVPGG